MSLFGWLRRPRLVPIALFADRDRAEEAWELLSEHDIPASVDADPGLLGSTPMVRLMVERPKVEEAQRLVADLVRSDREASGQE